MAIEVSCFSVKNRTVFGISVRAGSASSVAEVLTIEVYSREPAGYLAGRQHQRGKRRESGRKAAITGKLKKVGLEFLAL